jgi:hypothetical protein
VIDSNRCAVRPGRPALGRVWRHGRPEVDLELSDARLTRLLARFEHI